MSIIKILPENLVNQIAAGEVVERPASVVKELIENSLDAGATNIVVEVANGGKSFIKVADNGIGMGREDLEMAVKRHATSKIQQEADLWKISTMGFRGEALASICSVSKLAIKSKKAGEVSGFQLNCVGGDMKSISEVGMSEGTKIEVDDLFFNTPARQKYLKKDSTELNHIVENMNAIALANPTIAFKLVHNGKVVFDLAKVTDLAARVSDVFGKSTADAMIPVFFGGSSFEMDGFIGKPILSRSTSKHQYFFVNGRPIQHHLLAHTIKSAYHSMLMEHKKPVFILNIKIDPALIDVNVHPRKVEVRFEDQQTILKTLYGAVKTALNKEDLVPKGFSESRRYMSEGVSKGGNFLFEKKNMGGVQEAIDFSKEILAARSPQSLSEAVADDKSGLRSITQVANSYIVAQNDEGLVLIDQHAAHERVRYEQLTQQFEAQEKSVQPLLVPQQMELSIDEVALVEANKNIFEGLGFEIENFGGNTFMVHAVPGFLSSEDIDDVIKGVLDDILNEKNPGKMQGKSEEILTYMACRSAVKFGDSLSLDEIQGLLKELEKLERQYTCPHGRPTMIKLTMSELEKMFGRK